MLAFIKRNLLLFFRNRAGVFFSVLGALIAFVLYLVFLKKNMTGLWPISHPEKLLDPWLIGGTLTITAVTTTQDGLARMIVDRENGNLSDYLLTEASYLRIQFGYLPVPSSSAPSCSCSCSVPCQAPSPCLIMSLFHGN